MPIHEYDFQGIRYGGFFVVVNNVAVIIDIKAILCSIRKLQK